MPASEKAEQPHFAGRAMPFSSRVAVVTDSVAQVEPQFARDLGITVVPMKLILGDQEYRDGIDIAPAELYRRMREEKALPRTSSPSVGDYVGAFTELLRNGAEAIVCLTPSSRLTMAFNAASWAAQMARPVFSGKRVAIVDTRIAACAQGFVALQAARVAAGGASVAQVVATAEAARQRVGLVATVDTLEYLVRGGRVSLAAGLLGNLLQVKPLLTIESDGTATCIARKRTTRAALDYMLEYVADRTHGRSALQLTVMQADAPQEAAELKRLLLQAWPTAEVVVTDFTPVMGGHTGPGLIGLAFYYE
ncbi:MAG: DegV family protein [Anaerolineae bacterium]